MTMAPGIVLPEAEIAEICRRYEIRELSIFGSVVRGEIGPESGIDVLVDFLPGAEVSLFRHAAAERMNRREKEAYGKHEERNT